MGGETPYTLSRGAHPSADDGRCAMEWVAYLAGERHSDEPRCVCRALRQFTVRLNDSMPDDVRQKLRPYLARMIGSADDRLAPSRSWRMVDWAAREVVPLTLETVGRGDLSAELRALRPVRHYPSAQQAADVLQRASGAAGLDARVRHVVRVAASAARGRVPSQVAETAARAAQDVGVAGIWPRVLSLLDELLPGEVVTVPEADNWRAVCDATAICA
jgi:hypothetical protein